MILRGRPHSRTDDPCPHVLAVMTDLATQLTMNELYAWLFEIHSVTRAEDCQN
jgi:hypothetical protein